MLSFKVTEQVDEVVVKRTGHIRYPAFSKTLGEFKLNVKVNEKYIFVLMFMRWFKTYNGLFLYPEIKQ